jgi:TetR/AcrR family transcriptional regulator, transcriptional repressor for nem operon
VRYSEEHKARTRDRIIQAASREFRRKGAHGLSVADIMKAEGLTHGGFYRHFPGKEALLIEAVEMALDQVADRLCQMTVDLPRQQALERVINFYLSEEHMEYPQYGCAFAALGTELARYPKRCRAPIARALDQYRFQLQSLLPGRTEGERKACFDVLFPSMAGCLMAARAQIDPERRREILQHARSFFLGNFSKGFVDSREEQS